MIKTGLISLLLFYFSNLFAQQVTIFTAFTGQDQEQIKEQSDDFGNDIKSSIQGLFVIETVTGFNSINCQVADRNAAYQKAAASFSSLDTNTIHFVFFAGGWEVKKESHDSIYFGLRSNGISLRYILNFLGFSPSRNQICIFLLPDASGQPLSSVGLKPAELPVSGHSFIQIQADKETEYEDLLDELIDSIEDNNGRETDLDTNLDKIIDLNEWFTGLNKSFVKKKLKPTFFQQSVQPAKQLVSIKK